MRSPARPPRAAPQDRRRRLQQGAPLFEDPVVVRAHAGPARLALHQQVVQEPAPGGRITLDQRQVLGREEHRPQMAERLPWARNGRAVDPCPVGPSRVDLDLHQRFAAVADHRPAHDRLGGTEAHQRLVAGDAM